MQDTLFPTFSFTTGFLLGQTSLALLLFAFIKFFIFGEPPSSSSNSSRRHRTRSYSSPHNPIALSTSFTHDRPKYSTTAGTTASVLRPTAPLTTNAVLAKTYYNVSNHQPESVDWFNVLIAQTIAQIRVDASQDAVIVSALTSAINGSRKPDWLDDISVTEISLGEEFPIFSNCRVIPVAASEGAGINSDGRPEVRMGSDGTRLQARMDVDLSDALTLGIETKLVLNYPRKRVAVMPVALAVSVVRFSGTLSISFIPSPASSSSSASSSTDSVGHTYTKNSQETHPTTPAAAEGTEGQRTTPQTTLTFSFSPSYRLELSTHSLLGSRARLQDVPKIGQLVEAQLHKWFDERCVSPRFQQVVLPSLWPRARNTRGGDMDADEDDQITTERRGASRDLSDLDGKDDAAVSEYQDGQAPEGLQMPRMRRKDAAKNIGVEPPGEFGMPGGLPDG